MRARRPRVFLLPCLRSLPVCVCVCNCVCVTIQQFSKIFFVTWASAAKQSSQEPSTCTNEASLEAETGLPSAAELRSVAPLESSLAEPLPLPAPASVRGAGSCTEPAFGFAVAIPPWALSAGCFPSTWRVTTAFLGGPPLVDTASSTIVPGSPASRSATCLCVCVCVCARARVCFSVCVQCA